MFKFFFFFFVFFFFFFSTSIYGHGDHFGHVTGPYVLISFPLCLEAAYEIQLKLAQ